MAVIRIPDIQRLKCEGLIMNSANFIRLFKGVCDLQDIISSPDLFTLSYSGTTLSLLREGVSISDVTISTGGVSPTGLEKIDEGNGDGWRFIGSSPTDYSNIGFYATDLSFQSLGTYGVALGASGAYSFVTGRITEASGLYSVAMGDRAKATGDGSISLGGPTSIASGDYSVAFNAKGIGNESFAAAAGEATGTRSVALGDFAKTDANKSSAIGAGTQTKSYGESAYGIYNTSYTPSSTLAFISTDRLYVIGNGSSTGSRSDAFLILKSGDTSFPSLTNSMIDAAGGDSAVTKQWVQANSSTRYVQTFVVGDWSSQTIIITEATHGKGTDPIIQILSGAAAPYTVVDIDSISVAANGDITMTVIPGSEFDGKVVII